MVKHILMMIAGVFGVASVAVAGAQLNTLTVRPGFNPGGLKVHGKLPDLIPVVINANRGAIQVRNIGVAPAGASKLFVVCSVRSSGRTSPCAAGLHLPNYDAARNTLMYRIPALRPGASHALQLFGARGGLPRRPGTYGMKLFADGERRIAESNERNNASRLDTVIRGKPFHPKPHGKKPDLIPQASNPFRGIVVVKNQGSATAGASKVVLTCKKVGHRGPGGGCVDSPALNRYYDASLGGMAFPVSALRPGQAQRIRIPGWGSLHWPNGGYLFTVMADGGRVVAESNERNNKMNTSMKVAGKPVPHGKKPDLIPLTRASNPFTGVVKVKNQGRATAGASKLVLSCKKVGHRGSGGGCPDSPTINRLYAHSSGGLVIPVPALRAGQVYTINLPVNGLRWTKGQYKFTFNADASHAVAESNERNNLKGMLRRR